VVAILGGLVGTAACAPVDDVAAAGCQDLKTPVYASVNPTDQSSFFTTSSVEAADFTRRGYTYKELLGPSFMASTVPGPDLVEVHRLYRKKNRDFLMSADPGEIDREVRRHGYVDQGAAFYLSDKPQDCLVPVHRYAFRGQHRLVVGDKNQQLTTAGWKDEGVKFYASASTFAEASQPSTGATGNSSFTIAVMPDTQLEVVRARDTRLRDRSVWLVENQKRLNLGFVIHTGDVVDADNRSHVEYRRAQKGFQPLQAAGIPYTLAIGNRDTPASCDREVSQPSGAKAKALVERCADPVVRRQVRDTSVFNHYFSAEDFTHLEGQFEKGKVDNEYATYQAGGAQWLVLTLELWSRPEVVTWANKVVATHPDANVIVATHSYLTASGDIMQTNGGYGSTSPQYLFDHLIKKHENIKMVLSGHTGATAHRVDKGVHGNRIYSFLQAIHDQEHNPVRLIEVDTKKNTLSTKIYSPDVDRVSAGTEVSYDHLDLVR